MKKRSEDGIGRTAATYGGAPSSSESLRPKPIPCRRMDVKNAIVYAGIVELMNMRPVNKAHLNHSQITMVVK